MMKAQESMQSSHMTDIAIRVSNLSKRYEIYAAPRDRLKQFVMPALRRIDPTPCFPLTIENSKRSKEVSFEVKNGETLGIIEPGVSQMHGLTERWQS